MWLWTGRDDKSIHVKKRTQGHPCVKQLRVDLRERQTHVAEPDATLEWPRNHEEATRSLERGGLLQKASEVLETASQRAMPRASTPPMQDLASLATFRPGCCRGLLCGQCYRSREARDDLRASRDVGRRGWGRRQRDRRVHRRAGAGRRPGLLDLAALEVQDRLRTVVPESPGASFPLSTPGGLRVSCGSDPRGVGAGPPMPGPRLRQPGPPGARDEQGEQSASQESRHRMSSGAVVRRLPLRSAVGSTPRSFQSRITAPSDSPARSSAAARRISWASSGCGVTLSSW